MGIIIRNPSFQRYITYILIQFVVFSINAASEKGHPYFDEADKALLSGDYDKAVSSYLKGINYADKRYTSKIWDDLGYAYLQKGEYKTAITYLKNSISAHPDNFNTRLYLAASYICINEARLASQELDQIDNNIYFDESWLSDSRDMLITNEYGDEASKHELDRLWKEKGVYFHKDSKDLGSLIRAVLHIDAFNEINTGVFYIMQGFIYNKLNDYQIAEDFREIFFKFQHRLKDHDNSLLRPKLQQALNEIIVGKFEEAIRTLEEAMIINEKSFAINYNLALLCFDEFQLDPEKSDKLDKAEIYCARALWFRKYQTANKEDIIGCYDLMANIYSLKREYDKSLIEYKEILEIDPKNAHAHYNLGVVYFNIKDYKSAEKEWLDAIELEKGTQYQEEDKGVPGNILARSVTVRKRPISYLSHLALGNLYIKQRQNEKAISELEMAISIRTNAADPHLLLAKAYQKIDAKEKAVFHLERYIFLGGKDEKEAKELLRQLKK